MFVADQYLAEKELHIALESYRVNNDREFFRIELDKARQTLQSMLITTTLAELLKWNDEPLAELIDRLFRRRPNIRNNF